MAMDDLRMISFENLDLYKDLSKSIEESYFISDDTFESALKHV